MKQQTLEGKDSQDLAEDIRGVFKKLKNATMRDLAQKVIDSGLISDDRRESLLLQGVEALCRDACKQLGPDGLPLAKPMSGGKNAVWKTLDLFTYKDMCGLLERESEALTNDYEQLLKLWRYCAKRFGKAPEIPKLTQLATA